MIEYIIHFSTNSTCVLNGKYGFALIGDTEKIFSLILYKDKENILLNLDLSEDFKFMCREKVLSFYDDNGTWETHFETIGDINEFISSCDIRRVLVLRKSVIDLPSYDTKMEKNDKNVPPDVLNSNAPPDVLNSNAKADILSRITKMGQSILPKVMSTSNVTNSGSESSIRGASTINESRTKKNSKNDVEDTAETVLNLTPSSCTLTSTDVPSVQPVTSPIVRQTMQPFVMKPGQPIPIHTTYPSQNITTVHDPLGVYFSENRSYNSEMRINLSTVNSKLDLILGKFPGCDDNSRTNYEELCKKIEYLERKLRELENKSSCSLDKTVDCNENENKSNKHAIFEGDKLLDTAKVNDDIQNHLDKETRLNEIISQQTAKMNTLENNFEDEMKKCKDLQLMVTVLQENVIVLEKNEEKLKKDIEKLENSLARTQHWDNKNMKQLSDRVKFSMSSLYQNLTQTLKENSSDSGTSIEDLLFKHIKLTTYKMIENIQSDMFSDNNKAGKIVQELPPKVPEIQN